MRYIIETGDPFKDADGNTLVKVNGFNSLVFDLNGLDKLQMFDDDFVDKELIARAQYLLSRFPSINDRDEMRKADEEDYYFENVLKVRYHYEEFPDLKPIEQHGNFFDLYVAEELTLKAGEFGLVNLGVSVECPSGYWLQLVPRSSTFKNTGLIQTNSFGVIDTSYCGDDDIIKMPVYATRDITVEPNTKICQFRLVKDEYFTIEEVKKLDGPNRGGFGSTGK